MKINNTKKDRILRASKDIATGIIQCGVCNNRFYYKEQKIKKNKGRNWLYTTYFHHQFFNHKVCSQKPKSFYTEYINEIFKIFYFYFLLVFDNRNERIKESQRNIKQSLSKIKERITKVNKEIPVIKNRIEKFRIRLDKPIDDDLIDILLHQISENEKKLNTLNIELSKLKIDYELQNDKFNMTLLEQTYYDVKEKKKMNDFLN